ncbi:MAG: addiction module protein, partial [Verrucomicrobiae bacterium]|nr:addiction module protein [Verrucomicrobiae bacterium]
MVRILDEFKQMTMEERLRLVGELWDQIALSEVEIPVPPHIIEEVKRRQALYRENPERVISWEEVRNKIRGVRG